MIVIRKKTISNLVERIKLPVSALTSSEGTQVLKSILSDLTDNSLTCISVVQSKKNISLAFAFSDPKWSVTVPDNITYGDYPVTLSLYKSKDIYSAELLKDKHFH